MEFTLDISDDKWEVYKQSWLNDEKPTYEGREPNEFFIEEVMRVIDSAVRQGIFNRLEINNLDIFQLATMHNSIHPR